MEYTEKKITDLLSQANTVSTEKAENLNSENIKSGKFKPLLNAAIKFITSFFSFKKKLGIKDRFVYSCLASLEELLIYLKLLKLKKII